MDFQSGLSHVNGNHIRKQTLQENHAGITHRYLSRKRVWRVSCSRNSRENSWVSEYLVDYCRIFAKSRCPGAMLAMMRTSPPHSLQVSSSGQQRTFHQSWEKVSGPFFCRKKRGRPIFRISDPLSFFFEQTGKASRILL